MSKATLLQNSLAQVTEALHRAMDDYFYNEANADLMNNGDLLAYAKAAKALSVAAKAVEEIAVRLDEARKWEAE